MTFYASAWQIALAALLPVIFCLLRRALHRGLQLLPARGGVLRRPFEVVLRDEPGKTMRAALEKL